MVQRFRRRRDATHKRSGKMPRYEQVQPSSVQVVNVGGIFDRAVAELVGLAKRDTGFDTRSCHPDGEACGV